MEGYISEQKVLWRKQSAKGVLVEHELIMKYHLLSSTIKQILLPDLSKYFTFFKQDTFRNLHEFEPLEIYVTFTKLEWIGP
jgi:hypothetical protein